MTGLFSKKVEYEEKELTEEEATKLGKVDIVKFLPNGNVIVKVVKQKEKAMKNPSPNKEDIVDSVDIKAKTSIKYQITRVKDMKRVVIKTGRFKKGQLWITKAIKQRLYYADLKQLAWVEKKGFLGGKYYEQMLIFDIFYS